LQNHALQCNVTVMNCHDKLRVKFPHIVKAGNAVVKIYRGKAGGYDLFTVVHYRDGVRRRHTFGKYANARSHAQEVATQIAHGQLDVLSLTNSDRGNYVAAMNLLEPFGIPLRSAVEEYIAARSHLDGESLLSAVKEHAARRRHVIEKNVGEIVDEMLAAKGHDGLSNRYLYMLRSDLTRFKNSFQTNIGSISSKVIDDWLLAQNVTARTRNNLRAAVITLFNFAKSRGYLPKGQPTEADDVRRAKDRGGKIGILTPKELAGLIVSTPDEIKLYLALGAFTGMRASEILRLDWGDVNFERGHITVAADKAKTATRRLVPIQPNLMQWLTPYRGRRGKVVSHRADYRAIAFANKRGLTWPHNCLRHSYATYRLAAVADTARVALEMGNSPQKLMTNYRELADEHEARAWFAISPRQPQNVVELRAG
jgi:integrase